MNRDARKKTIGADETIYEHASVLSKRHAKNFSVGPWIAVGSPSVCDLGTWAKSGNWQDK